MNESNQKDEVSTTHTLVQNVEPPVEVPAEATLMDAPRVEASATEVDARAQPAGSVTAVDVPHGTLNESAASASSPSPLQTSSQTDVQTLAPQQAQSVDPQVVETVIQQADSSETQFETPDAKLQVRTAGGRRPMLKTFGDYEVISEIARGGMGVVYRARQKRLNRVVAVKMILQGQLASDGDIQRFYSEAEAAARLEHPGIVPIYEVGEHEGQHYFSMGFVDGESLADRVRRGPLPAREAAALLRDVAEAIEYAHQHGIVHRDLKPGNILLTRDGQPRVTDFGLAKAIEQDSGLTASGQILGTPSYMPPEQAAGRIREIGPLSDVYSLGAVLYCLLVGRPPFQGATVMETLKHVVESAPVSPRLLNPSVDRDLETICLKCLEKTPAHRLASAGELAAELQRYLAGESIRSRRVNAATRVWRWCRRKPLAAALVASVLVLGVAIAAGFSFAKSASATRELSTLQTEFERKIDDAQLSEQWLNAADQLASRISALPKPNEDAPNDHAIRITDAFAELLRKDLKRPKLSSERAESLRASIHLLKGRAPSLADDLLKQLEGRLTDWVIDFELNALPSVATKPASTEPKSTTDAPPISEQLTKIFGANKVHFVRDSFMPLHGENSTHAVVGMTAKAAHADAAQDIKYVVAPRTVTLHSCRDDIELSAVFAPEWRSAPEIGLSLNAIQSRGYDFVVRVLDAPRRTTSQTEDGGDAPLSQQDKKQFVAEVRRHGVPLLRRVLSSDSLPTGPLQLRARRQRGDLEFQVHTLPAVRFTDPFPLRADASGVFALRWPASVPLQSLSAQHRPRAVATSGIEQGDELFDDGKFAEAAEKYRQQMTDSDDESVQHEARYKLGATLMALQRPAEADEVLAPLLANQQSSWAALSGVQMLVSALRRKQPTEADSLIEILSSRFRFEELAMLVPTELRDEILKNYAQSFLSVSGVLQFDANRLQKIERAAAIDRLLSTDGLGDFFNQMELVRVYRYVGKWPEALAAIEPLLKRSRDATTMRHFCRILRFHGLSQRAIDEIDASLSGRVPMAPPHTVIQRQMLLLERARANYVLGKIANCEADLRTIMALADPVKFEPYTLAASAAMLGLLLEDRGHTAAALEIWRESYRRGRVLFDGKAKNYDTSVILVLLLGSLSGELLEADANEFVRLVSAGDSGGSLVSMATSLVTPQSIAEGMREMWRTPRGKLAARDFAFELIPLRERTRLPVVLLGQTFFRQKAFESVLTDEQDQVLWDFVSEGHAGVLERGTLKASQLMQLALTWKGTTNFVGWGGVAPSLPPELRAKAAWMFGHRFLRLGKPAEAKQFFETARKDAPLDSVLAKIVKQDLELLQQDRARLLVTSNVRDAVVTVRRGTETVATLELRSQPTSEVLLPIGNYELEVSGPQQALTQCDAAVITMSTPDVTFPTKAAEPSAAPTALTQAQPTRLNVKLPPLATATLRLLPRWREPTGTLQLAGIVPTPAMLPELGRWQIKRRHPHGLLHLPDWSPDGKLIAMTSQSHAIEVVGADDGRVESMLLGHNLPLRHLKWSPDGLWIASNDFSGSLFIWDVKHSRLVFKRSDQTGGVSHFAWSPDGKAIAVAEHGGVAILNLAGVVLSRIAQTTAIWGLNWSADGQRLAMALQDNHQIAIATLNEQGRWGEPRLIATQIEPGPSRVVWSPDSRLLIAASPYMLEVWDAAQWQLINQWQAPEAIHCHWESDSKHILIAGGHSDMLRFEARAPKGSSPERIATNFPSTGCALSPDQQHIARAGNRELRVFDRQGVLQKTFSWGPSQAVMSVAWAPDGRRLASTADERFLLHEVSGAESELRIGKLLSSYAPTGAEIPIVKWSPDGSTLAASNWGGTICLFSPDGTKMVKRQLGSPATVLDWLPRRFKLRSEPALANDVSVEKNASALDFISVNQQRKLQVLTRTGDVRAELADFKHNAFALSVSPSGQQVAVSLLGSQLVVVSLSTGEQRSVSLKGNAYYLLWSPDEKTVYAGSEALQAIDVDRMQVRSEAPYLHCSIGAMCWRPGGDSIYATSRIGHLFELNLKGEVVRTLRQPPGDLMSLSLHPDQRTLAVGTHDGAVELWDSEQAKPLGILLVTQHGGCLSLSATGEPLSLTSGKPDANGNAPTDELDNFVWIVESESGEQSMLSAAEFFARQQAAFDRETLARVKQSAVSRESPATVVKDVGKLSVAEIQEASGLIASRKHEGVFWTISDSGNPANLYALDETGRVLATYKIAGATNSDWESITIDEHSRLFIGDTGNAARVATRAIYEVDEPDPRAAAASNSSYAQPIELPLRRKLTFSAPTPQTDFEAAFVLGGQFFLPSKVSSGTTQLFALDIPSAEPASADQSFAVELKALGPIPNANWITDATVHPSGKRLALLTYSEAILFDLPESGKLPAASANNALPTPAARVRFEAPFIEAAAFDRTGNLLLLSETGTLHRLAQ